MMRFLFSSRVILPFTMGIGVLVLGLRISDVWDAAASGKLFARAQAETAAATPPASDAGKNATASAPAATPAVTPPPAADANKDAGAPKPDADKTAAAGTTPEIAIPDDASPAEMEVLKQLSNRRQELEKRAQELDAREDLLKVAEQRVDTKIRDMTTLQKQLQSMVGQANEAQAAQMDNLVKIYETMKPKDAAKIFEQLEMPVLLSVIQRMKPKSTAPIMAEMNPDKAKEITVALTKQDKLPQVK